jgi:flagellar biosynthesis regulator FlaF
VRPFRKLSAPRPFPRFGRGKQAALVAFALVAVGACGGDETEVRSVAGADYRFDAPADWDVQRAGRTIAVTDDSRAVSVTTFRLARPFRTALWRRVVEELDAVAERLARELNAQIVRRSTTVIDGRRARLYRYEGARDDTRRIAFVLVGRREFQLLCRGDAERECDVLLASFRVQ